MLEMDCRRAILLSVVAFLDGLPLIEAKYCHYIDGSGIVRNFQCHPLESCCGRSCCEQFNGFYRLWYFWLCVMLALMFCSGGGYWYRRHVYQRHLYMTSSRGAHNPHPPQSTSLMLLSGLNPPSTYRARASNNPLYDYPTSYEYPTTHNAHPAMFSSGFTQPVWSGNTGDIYTGSGNTGGIYTGSGNTVGVYSGSGSAVSVPPPSYSELLYTTPTPPPTYSMAVARQTQSGGATS